jgi:alkylation response protein AidB-like acyl-CoA dehydrogenase
VAITSGQWMTESQGGSDISRTGTVATSDSAGTWRLTGEKWFCSAIDSAMAVALARPDGATPGSRTLVPFLVPRYAPDGGPAAGITLHRLKDKLGTRAVPTAEVGLAGARAIPLGDPAAPGLVRMMTLVVVTRLHNAAAAAGGMRRGLGYAKSYADQRTVAGGRLADNPLHRATLGTLAVDAAGAYALAAHAFWLLGRVEAGVEGAISELRLVAPLAKLVTGKLAVASASEYLECFGGAGYVEDTGVPRLLRDAQVLPIWEGTTNVLSVDVLRALGAAKQVLARVAEADAIPAEALGRLTAEVEAAVADPHAPSVVAGARGLALRLGYALTGALLAEHAAWSRLAADATLATLWTERHLGGADIAEPAHRAYDDLV